MPSKDWLQNKTPFLAAGTGKLELMRNTKSDMIGLDWAVDMSVARNTLGRSVPVQGNVDPMVLFGPEKVRHWEREEDFACTRIYLGHC